MLFLKIYSRESKKKKDLNEIVKKKETVTDTHAKNELTLAGREW